MSFSFWLSLLVCFFIGCAYADVCPPEQLVRPCRCIENSFMSDVYNAYVLCQNITSQDIIDGVFRRLGDSKLDVFILDNSEVNYIPSYSLTKNKFKYILITNSTLVKFFESAPSDINNLTRLELRNVTFKEGFSFTHLKPLQKLWVFLVQDTDIPQLGKDFSLSLSNDIHIMTFLRTNTHTIDYSFLSKPNLKEIRITNGSLTRLHRSSFHHPASNLETLSLDNNEIEVLPPDQFKLMSKLTRVTLTNNNINQVSEKVFGSIYNQLEYLYLNGNPINCDCSIKWITERSSAGKTVTGNCVQPPALAGKKIVDLKPSDLPNC